MADIEGTKGNPPARSRPYSPGKFRAMSHDSAHLEADQALSPKVNHPLVPGGEAEFIDRQDALLDLLDHLRDRGRFAYDSEFIGELTYIPKLCLIQVASTERIGLIDPLCGLDLSPFWELLCDPAVEKVVHAGQQDVEPIHRNHGKIAANLFDTQICAGFAGLAYPTALSKLVLGLVGAKLGKGLTFTHWDQRPLSAMQLRYAADDVRYLVAVRDLLDQQMGSFNHREWARIECDGLCDPAQYGFNPTTHYLKIRGSNSLSSKQQAILRELTIWRDRCAQARNVPARTFLKDEIMLDLARTPIKGVEKLDRVRGLPRPVEQAHGAEIVAATAKGLSTPVDDLPVARDIEPTPQQRFQTDSVYAAFLCLCAGQSIDPALVASRQEVSDIYRALAGGESAQDHGLLQGWRKEAVGNSLVDLLAGKLRLNVRWDGMLRTVKETIL